ncbi:Lipoprotein-releasing system ATP-binding protein LolD [Dyadobacter sp. CECT 9623]|uniref:Lipoprotein-releasing system ATP-binding protein LolD n=1 Tax=Dyadobacter linearis TaxID=2823330 RepID=A0ABN7RJV7_9BACT|nr:ATP-binding cassette domain-containing protein [Dyadobacter sp. CECT 9623]CAG5074299.1 Lipoprotein-releasing system ATP-binding protein LolD [Dyadobacter sp. CECT 9623]
MITSHNLKFSYSAQKKFQFPDISCGDRETLLILGQSGKGKTTLLHLLALLLQPESGEVIIGGRSIKHLSHEQIALIRAKTIGIVYQRAHFVSALSVIDNMLLSNFLAEKDQDRKRAIYLANELGFAEHLSKKTSQLSQGEQQRVSIARALMNDPNVILADEPTSSLDDLNCQRVIDLLKTQSASIGASLVVVTHDQRLKSEFSNQVIL